jgi:hypothetical protein
MLHAPHLQDREAILVLVDMPSACVRCSRALDLRDESLMMINEIGDAIVCKGPAHFCSHCPAVYLPEKHYSGVAKLFEMNPYTLVGFLDLEALPEAQRDQPLGEDDGPIPLCEFTSLQPLQQLKIE